MISNKAQYFLREGVEADRAVAPLVATLFLGVLLGALIAFTVTQPRQPSAEQRCRAGHDPLAESCLISGATPKAQPRRRYAARRLLSTREP